VAEGRSVAVSTHGPPSVGASVMVVHEPTNALVLLSSSQVSVTKLSSVEVTMTQCIRYVMCHGKVVMSFTVRAPEFAALGFGPAVPPRQPAHLVAKGHGGSNIPKLLVPRHHLPSLKLSR
jgi:hypothetical protein